MSNANWKFHALFTNYDSQDSVHIMHRCARADERRSMHGIRWYTLNMHFPQNLTWIGKSDYFKSTCTAIHTHTHTRACAHAYKLICVTVDCNIPAMAFHFETSSHRFHPLIFRINRFHCKEKFKSWYLQFIQMIFQWIIPTGA